MWIMVLVVQQSAVISEIILSEKNPLFYVAAGNEPRPLSIGQDSFITQINSYFRVNIRRCKKHTRIEINKILLARLFC